MIPPTPARLLMALLSLVVLPLSAAKADPPAASVGWDKAVDGLEPGIQLTTPGMTANRHAPFNSRVAYNVLIRNVSNQERVVEIHDNSDTYLIPNNSLRDTWRNRVLPERFRALGVTDLSVAPGIYDVELAPGEAVVLRGERGLYLGTADPQRFPRVEAVQRGKNWIIQPISIYVLNAAEKARYEKTSATAYIETKQVTIIGRDGKTRESSAAMIGGHADVKLLFARMHIDVETQK